MKITKKQDKQNKTLNFYWFERVPLSLSLRTPSQVRAGCDSYLVNSVYSHGPLPLLLQVKLVWKAFFPGFRLILHQRLAAST